VLPALFARAPGRLRSPGAALIREGVWPLSHPTPPALSQSCRPLAPPAFPFGAGWGGGGTGLSLSALWLPRRCDDGECLRR